MRKRIKKYNNGGISGLIQGATQGAPMGLPGMIIGGGLGYLQGSAASQAEAEAARMAEEERKLKEEQRAIEERNAAVAQNKAILDAFPVKGTATPRFGGGGATGKLGDAMQRDDSFMENILEFVDPTGITSYDDAYRAYNSMKAAGRKVPNFEEFVDMLGAVPLVGKAGKALKGGGAAMKAIQNASAGARVASSTGKLLNALDTGQDIYSDNIKSGPGMSKTKQPRFDEGGKTPKPDGGGSRADGTYSMVDLFRAIPGAQKLLWDSDVQKAYKSMSQDDVNLLIQEAVNMRKQVDAADTLGEKIGLFKNTDLSWVKPLREKAGLSKNQLIDKAVEVGMLKPAAAIPVKGAALFKDFALGGSTLGPDYEVEGGEMMQTNGEQPKVYGQGGMSQVSSNEFEVKGPKHSGGGVKASDNNGARVYSDKLKVDSSLAAKLMKL